MRTSRILSFFAAGTLGVLAACSSSSNDNNPPPVTTPSDGGADATRDALTDILYDVAAPEIACVATSDIASESMAKTICGADSDCKVCPQQLDDQGKPRLWLAQQHASACGCPTPGKDKTPIEAGPPADAKADVPCTATFDIGSESMAHQICGSDQDCTVCVQNVDAQGNATTWLAQQNASCCPCPTPTTR